MIVHYYNVFCLLLFMFEIFHNTKFICIFFLFVSICVQRGRKKCEFNYFSQPSPLVPLIWPKPSINICSGLLIIIIILTSFLPLDLAPTIYSPHRRQDKFFYIILFLYFWLCWVFIAGRAFLQLLGAGATLHCSAQASHYGGLSCCRAQALGLMGLSSGGTRAQQLRFQGSRAQAQQWWHQGLVALWYVGSSWTAD